MSWVGALALTVALSSMFVLRHVLVSLFFPPSYTLQLATLDIELEKRFGSLAVFGYVTADQAKQSLHNSINENSPLLPGEVKQNAIVSGEGQPPNSSGAVLEKTEGVSADPKAGTAGSEDQEHWTRSGLFVLFVFLVLLGCFAVSGFYSFVRVLSPIEPEPIRNEETRK